jgi:PhnB protein
MILDGQRLMASDMPPGIPFEPMKGMTVSLSYKTAEEGRRIFNTLSACGQVQMTCGKTFWADGFGMCVDRFGTPWMVNAGDAGGAQG